MAIGNMMSQAMGMGTPGMGGGGIDPNDPIVMIERLSELKGKGLLSQEEFDKKKAELLAKIK